MNNEIVVTEQIEGGAAGLIVWWELHGLTAVEDIEDALDGTGFTPPSSPSLVMALQRAAKRALPTNRHLLRPLRRGVWEVVLETVVPASDGEREHLKHERVLSGYVEDGQAVVEGDDALRTEVLSKVGFYQRVLTPEDISSWLLWRASALHAVALRQRGGFYFIPADLVVPWRRLVAAVRSASEHSLWELPAMRTSEAVEAVLTAVRLESEARVAELERWLAEAGDDASTRGLNAATRETDAVRAKVSHYTKLLGREMPDMVARLEKLTGAVQAARLAATAE